MHGPLFDHCNTPAVTMMHRWSASMGLLPPSMPVACRWWWPSWRPVPSLPGRGPRPWYWSRHPSPYLMLRSNKLWRNHLHPVCYFPQSTLFLMPCSPSGHPAQIAPVRKHRIRLTSNCHEWPIREARPFKEYTSLCLQKCAYKEKCLLHSRQFTNQAMLSHPILDVV